MAIRNKEFPEGHEFSKFALGYNNIGVPGSLKPGALADCKNFNITRQGKLTKRNGCTRYQTTACGSTTKVNTIYEYKSPGGQYVSTYVLVASGTKVYSYYNSKWNDVKTPLTNNLKMNNVTHLGLCYGVNGTDDNFKIYSDGSGIETDAFFVGSGLDDVTYSGQYTHTTALVYRVKIDDEDSDPEKFTWSKDGGTSWVASGVAITGSAQTLDNGVIVTFAATTGHTVDDYWDSNCYLTYATSYNLGIAPPTSGDTPTASATTLTYVRRYLSANTYLRGKYNFCEFSDDLHCLDLHDTVYHGSILKSADGTTWAEAYEIADDHAGFASGHNFNSMDGNSVASYDGEFWFNLYDSTNFYTMVSWDDSTAITARQTAFKPDSSNNNAYAYGLTLWDSKVWWISDFTANVSDDYRCVHYYDGSSVNNVNAASSYGSSNAYLAYNKTSGLPENDIRERATQLFSWGDNMWLFATVYDSTNSKWAWEVWELWENYLGFEKRYDSDDINDGYMFSAVWVSQDAGTIYVLGNLPDGSGNKTEHCKLYKSTDMVNWEVVHTEYTMGYPYGTCTHKGVTMIHCQDDTSDDSFVYKFSDDNEDFTLEQTISTNTADGECGGIISWDNGTNTQLYLGKYKEIYERPVYDLTTTEGGYKYRYTYKRNAWKPFEGNPGSASTVIEVVNGKVDVTVVASTDSQVDKIVLYRTLDGRDTYYKHSEVANADASITDSTADDDLTTLLEYNNTVPPKAKYVILHNNRVVYLNCPDETDGDSLIMWSKSSYGEAVPSANYQYFDREDGEPITGGASIGDYLVVFKRNKFSVLSGDFDEASELYTTGYGLGCTSHYTIIPFEDKVVFLSEEGWKSFDGKNLYSMSEMVNGWREDGYYTPIEAAGYQSVYYSDREQFLTLMEHSTETDIVAVGHFLIPLTMADQGAPEFGTGVLASWTYHVYANHTLTAIGTYTDSSDITRVLAGDSAGWVYELDSGTADVIAAGTSKDIAYTFQTDWSTLGTRRYETKVCRRGYLAYTSSTTDTMTFNIEKDFSDTDDNQTVTCVTSGVSDARIQKLHLTGTGEVFRFTLSGEAQQSLGIIALQIYFRNLGIRP